jgi:hypothetical protein
MLGCSLAEIGPEQVLQSTTSQLLKGVLPLNISLRYASGLAEAEPLDRKVDDGARPYRCPLVEIPVQFAGFHLV